jgi:diguanylate cyclase (GGDEF)-like protein
MPAEEAISRSSSGRPASTRARRPLDAAARLRRLLPQGGSLPVEEWRRRHAGIMILLWLNVLVVPIAGVIGGRASLVHNLDSGIALGVLAALGAAPRLSRSLRMASASLGLLSAAAMLIHSSGGLIEMHFYFFVLVIVLTLYEDWMVFVLAIVFVLIHHGVLGTLEPKSVFDRPEEWANPWLWAGIHAAYVAAAGAAALVAWRLNENVRAEMRGAHRQLEIASETDSLTGLGNRRKLMSDLQEIADSGRSAAVVILDLDGFKAYNDTFGHPAGDSLLARLGARLREAVDGHGHSYRLGGDEFCVVWWVDEAGRANAEAVSAAALCEHGEGFSVTAAYGAVVMPGEAATVDAALHTADLRMYSRKQGSRRSSSVQSRDVLLQALAELRPQLGSHVDAVTVMAEDVARQLDLAPHLVEQVRDAAQLHDIGKIAIPDAILNKPGPLDAEEWTFMRRHTVIGERIVSAAPALAEVALLVRSSHERHDGDGYPDRLGGEAIPIGSRIISVCDAFDAMTTDRSYRVALTPPDALAELRRCAGQQFDPRVVEAFERTLYGPVKPSQASGRRRQRDAPGEPASPRPAQHTSLKPSVTTSPRPAQHASVKPSVGASPQPGRRGGVAP